MTGRRFSVVVSGVLIGVVFGVVFAPHQIRRFPQVCARTGRLKFLLSAGLVPLLPVISPFPHPPIPPIALAPLSSLPPTGESKYRPPANVKTRAVWLENRLNERDFAILETIARLEIVSGIQIERLHFADLRRGATVRRRVLARLTELRALNASSRVIGGTRGGATPYIYRLDPAAALLLRLRDGHSGAQPARPKGDVPLRVVSHALAVSELYVALVELARASGGYRISDYRAEPAAWWAELRPDAYAELAGSRFRDHWWIEVDRDTESTSLLRRRFSGYAAFAEAGLAGPGGVLPRVLVTVPTIRRRAALRRALRAIPDRHRHRFHVECFDDAAAFLAAQVDTASDPIDPTE